MEPSISVIMVDGSFRERFHAVGALARQTLADDAHELIWVEYFDAIRPDLQADLEKHPNSCTLKLGRGGIYHSSYCFNAGIMAATGDLVVIPDADVVVEEDFLQRILALHDNHEKLVTYCYRFNEPYEQRQEVISLDHLRGVCELTHPSNWGGCVAARKQWFVDVNGYEQHASFESGDHSNDFDMYTRFKNLGLHVCWPSEPVLYHPWHPGTLRYTFSHKLQEIVTRHRASQRTVLPYCGIDADLDREMPGDLSKRIETARMEFERARPNEGESFEAPSVLISHKSSNK